MNKIGKNIKESAEHHCTYKNLIQAKNLGRVKIFWIKSPLFLDKRLFIYVVRESGDKSNLFIFWCYFHGGTFYFTVEKV
jgi:hypothetical protein